MEERTEYSGQATGRRGKTFVGGYIEPAAALRLRRACEAGNITMVELLERMADKVTVGFEATAQEVTE